MTPLSLIAGAGAIDRRTAHELDVAAAALGLEVEGYVDARRRWNLTFAAPGTTSARRIEGASRRSVLELIVVLQLLAEAHRLGIEGVAIADGGLRS